MHVVAVSSGSSGIGSRELAEDWERGEGKDAYRILRPLDARVSTTFLVFLPRAEARRRLAKVGSSAGREVISSPTP